MSQLLDTRHVKGSKHLGAKSPRAATNPETRTPPARFADHSPRFNYWFWLALSIYILDGQTQRS
jgi:hypothetical protein